MNFAAPIRLSVETPAPLPVDQLVLGRPAKEAAALLPRLFNLCREAQGLAARLAMGLDPAEDAPAPLVREIRRDHAMRIGVILPRTLGAQPIPVHELMSGDRLIPESAGEFDTFLQSDGALPDLLRRIAQAFPAGTATTSTLPDPHPGLVLTDTAIENTVAARHCADPVMRHVSAHFGRGPLWRVFARVLDLSSPLPPVLEPRQGVAIVPAARGLYAVEATCENGMLTRFARRTPTDHLLAKHGILEQSLASCPPEHADLLLAILDPCVPLKLKQEPVHA